MLGEIFGVDGIVVVIVLAVVLFGGAAIPKLARNIGSAKNQFEKGLEDGKKATARQRLSFTSTRRQSRLEKLSLTPEAHPGSGSPPGTPLPPSASPYIAPRHPTDHAAANRGRMQRIDEVSDAQLVISIARFSEVALAEVYRRHGGAVFGLARRVCFSNESEAQDAPHKMYSCVSGIIPTDLTPLEVPCAPFY